jgi:asparagine synthase (glutamine-hydrolysing)
VLDRIVWAFDEPFADASAIPTFYVSSRSREHVTVALTGDGGDEAFAGYDFRYVPHLLESRVRPLVSAVPFGRPAASWLGRRWPASPRLPRPLRLGTLIENLARDAAAAYYFDLCFMKPRDARSLMGLDPDADLSASPVYDAVTEPYRRCPSASPLQRAEYADLKVYLPNDVLVKVDRMSMANSLEVRSPLLDRRVVEFAFRVPAATKMPWLKAKHLLKRVAARRLPPKLLSLPKQGFTAPVGAWLRGPYAERLRSEVLATDSLTGATFDLARVRALVDDHVAGRADRSYALWAIWMFERWGRLVRTRARAVRVSEAAQKAIP